MRILVFFDLPVVTPHDRKTYAAFRKNLIKDGFVMLQYSVYSKLVLNAAAAQATRDRLRRYKPNAGSIQMLIVTEQQFARIECLTGEMADVAIQSTERTVIL